MICFIAWDTKIAGGVQNLIINLTTHITKIGKEVTIVGYKTSHIVKMLEHNKVDFNFIDLEKYRGNDLKHKLDNKVVVFTSFSPNMGLEKLRGANPRTLYWNVFPTRLIDANKIGPLNIRFLTRRLIKILLKNDSCIFMDKNGWDEMLGMFKSGTVTNEVNYLPVPVSLKENSFIKRLEITGFTEMINISYIGRGSTWKIIPFIKFITSVDANREEDRHFTFHIISQDAHKYKQYIDNLDLYNGFTFLFKNDLYGSRYEKYLEDHIDLHVAMGTAALDGASLGIPTIVLDYSYTGMPKAYRYRWLHESSNYDLGHDASKIANEVGSDIDQILFPYLQNNSEPLKKISFQCYTYVKDNHDISKVAEKLIRYSKKSTTHVKTITNLTIVNNIMVRYLVGMLWGRKKKYGL